MVSPDNLFLFLLISGCFFWLVYTMKNFFVKEKNHKVDNSEDDNDFPDVEQPVIVKDLSRVYLKYTGSLTHIESGMVVNEVNTVYYLISNNVEIDSQISTEDFLFLDGRVKYVGLPKLFYVTFNLEPYGSKHDIRIVFAIHVDDVPVHPRMLYYAPSIMNASESSVSMSTIVRLDKENIIDLRVGIIENTQDSSIFQTVTIAFGNFIAFAI